MRQNLGNPALTFVFLITFFMTRKISELVHQKQVDLHVELDEQLVECLGIQWTPFSSLIILPVFFIGGTRQKQSLLVWSVGSRLVIGTAKGMPFRFLFNHWSRLIPQVFFFRCPVLLPVTNLAS